MKNFFRHLHTPFRVLLIAAVLFSGATAVFAVTPNPGHPWAEVGDGVFSVSGPSAMRVFTFPDANATVLTANSFSQGDIIFGSGAGATAQLAKDTNATRYLSNTGTSNNPAWAQVNLANGVTGVLPASNGGTGASSLPDQVMFAPIGLHAANLTAVTALPTGTTYFEYVGVAGKPYTSCNIVQNVTTAAATITWAEVAIFKGTPIINGNASLTRLGFTNVAATYNSTGRKNTSVTASVAAGDNIWAAFGSSATTPSQVRGLLADDLQSGVFQTAVVRPSLASSPQATTLAAAATVPSWVAIKCQ